MDGKNIINIFFMISHKIKGSFYLSYVEKERWNKEATKSSTFNEFIIKHIKFYDYCVFS